MVARLSREANRTGAFVERMAAVAALAESAWRRNVSAISAVCWSVSTTATNKIGRDIKRQKKAKKIRRNKTRDQDSSPSSTKQRRWNSCNSMTRIIVAPRPRPKCESKPADRKFERQKGEVAADRDIVATTQQGTTENRALTKSKRKVKRLAAKLNTWQNRAEIAEAATPRAGQLERLKQAAAEASIARNALLKYAPGEWDNVPEQHKYENARRIMQRIQQQKNGIAEISTRARRRMDREVNMQTTEQKAEIETLERKLNKLLAAKPQQTPKQQPKNKCPLMGRMRKGKGEASEREAGWKCNVNK